MRTPTVTLLLAMTLAAAPAVASDSDLSRATLKGVTAFSVVVEQVRPEVEQAGLTRTQLENDVEHQLQRAGVTLQPDAPAYLYVNVNVIKIVGGYAASVRVEFNQPASLGANALATDAVTWSTGGIVTTSASGMSSDIRKDVGDWIDRFLRAYRSVNPASGTDQPSVGQRPAGSTLSSRL